MSDHPHLGIVGDYLHREENRRRIRENEVQHQKLCEWCGGTGNEFYSMYRVCPECGGRGLVPDKETTDG